MAEPAVKAQDNEGTPIPGEVEDKARRMGWVDKEEFRGDEKLWVDAERFVERGENELPIMRERLKKMDGSVVSLTGKVSSLTKTLNDVQKFYSDSEERAYNRALKEITDKQREAVEEKDIEGFDALEKEKEELAKTKPVAPAAVDPAEAEEQEVFDGWRADNAWFDEDLESQQYAVHIARFLEDNKGLKGRALYDEVTKEVKGKFPDKFENKKRQEPTAVIDADTEVAPKKGKRTYANLPAEAKAECDRFVKEIPEFTKEEYLKHYEWE